MLVGEAKLAMMAEPDKALRYAREARVAAAAATPRDRELLLAEAGWLEGEALTRINRPEEARTIIGAALTTVLKLQPRSKLHGDLLMSAASINWMTGHIREALAQFQAAHGMFATLGEARSQAKALQYIGTIYFDARDYPRMLNYYKQSAEVFEGDPALTVAAYNNQGDALKEMRRFKEAIADYRHALAVAREIDSPVLEVRILTNLASAYVQAGALATAEATADRGLQRSEGHDSGWEPFLWGVKAQAALARGDLPSAQRNIERTFAGTQPTTTTVQFREFHETAFKLYEALGREKEALAHLVAFKRLDDEVREVAVSTNSAIATGRFDFANQELRIAKLKAGQLQRDIALQRSRAQFEAFVLYGALGAAGLVLAGLLGGFSSLRRSRNQVRDANRTLSQVNEELETALSAKTRFLATTSHEIRTPLNGILGMTQVMLHDRALPDPQRDRVRIVHEAGQTMKALVDDILDLAKIEGGKLVIEQTEVELRALLDGAAQLWVGQAESKGLALVTDLGRAPDRIVGDARRLRQVVFNLMSNAVKFTRSGTVTLGAEVTDGVLVLTVADTGIGIAPEQFDAVFKSFHQVDGEVTRHYGGTGLGLAICRELVAGMGGEIALESTPGVGSTFIVRLPLQACPVSAEPEPSDGRWPGTLADATVLVIEGNPLTRSVMAAALRGSVASVAVGDADAAAAAGRSFHHAVVDIGTLGVEAAPARIAALTADGAAATVLATEAVDPVLYAALARAGVVQVLTRPFAPADLVAALQRAHAARLAEVASVETPARAARAAA